MNPAPGFKKYPQHRVETRPASVRVRVTYQGELIADTREAVELHESFGEGKKTVAPVVYYIPRKGVRMDRLVRTSQSTHCPFKGDASYFTMRLYDGKLEDAAWSYERPYDEHRALAGRIAFDQEKIPDLQQEAAD